MVSVEIRSKALSEAKNLGGLANVPLSVYPAFLCPPSIQTSGSPKEFLEATVSGVVGSGGGWVLESGIGEARSWTMELADPSWGVVQKWQNEPRTLGAALIPVWLGSGTI